MSTDPATPAPTPDSSNSQPPRPRGKVFDIMRPGKAPASPTSRPVVIGHKAEAQHAQVVVSGIGETGPREGMLAAHNKSSVADVESQQTAVSDSHTSDSGPPTTVAAASDPEPTPEKSKRTIAKPAAEEDAEAEKPLDPAKLDEVALEPDTPPPAPVNTSPQIPPSAADAAPDDPVHAAAPPALHHQVVVSHHTTEPSARGRLIALIIFAAILLLIVLDILMDAGVITTSAIPHTHLF